MPPQAFFPVLLSFPVPGSLYEWREVLPGALAVWRGTPFLRSSPDRRARLIQSSQSLVAGYRHWRSGNRPSITIHSVAWVMVYGMQRSGIKASSMSKKPSTGDMLGMGAMK